MLGEQRDRTQFPNLAPQFWLSDDPEIAVLGPLDRLAAQGARSQGIPSAAALAPGVGRIAAQLDQGRAVSRILELLAGAPPGLERAGLGIDRADGIEPVRPWLADTPEH